MKESDQMIVYYYAEIKYVSIATQDPMRQK